MKRTFTSLAMVAAGFATMAASAGTAQAGGVVDELRSRGLGTWVDRYVEEDNKGNVKYKSAKSNTTTAAPTQPTTSNTVKATAPKKKKTLKKTAKKKSTKARTLKSASKKKATKKKVATRKLTKKKVAKKTTTKKVASNSTKKKYKVPSRVKDRLAAYGINF